MRKLAIVSAAAVVAWVSSWTSAQSVQPPSAAPQSEAAALRQAQSRARGYKIGPDDLISVTVYAEDSLNRRARVGESGTIFIPLAGAVPVAGKTLDEARELIAGRLSAYLKSPQVSIFVEEYGHKMFSVMGEVQKPGSFPIADNETVTLLQAISMAGGFTAVAADGKTRVLRNINGRTVTYTVDVRAITGKGHKEKDNMVLQPNDVVYVPQSMF